MVVADQGPAGPEDRRPVPIDERRDRRLVPTPRIPLDQFPVRLPDRRGAREERPEGLNHAGVEFDRQGSGPPLTASTVALHASGAAFGSGFLGGDLEFVG
jgi:hypothetical protein